MRILERGSGGRARIAGRRGREWRTGGGPGVGRTRNSPGWALRVSINDQSTGTPMDEATEGKRGGGGGGGGGGSGGGGRERREGTDGRRRRRRKWERRTT